MVRISGYSLPKASLLAFALGSVGTFALPTASTDAMVTRAAPAGLHHYHDDCDSPSKMRSNGCMAAIHRWCYDNGFGGSGYPQAIEGTNELEVICVHSNSYTEAEATEIPNCSLYGTQSFPCYEHTQHYCALTDGNDSEVGIIQEIGPTGFGVACVAVTTYSDVLIGALTNYQPLCSDLANAQGADCVAAASQYCKDRGFKGGIITNVVLNHAVVGCITNDADSQHPTIF